MKTFKQYAKEQELEEGWGKNIAMGAALLGAGFGASKLSSTKAPVKPPETISQSADQDSHWNSQLGDYTVSTDSQGRTVYNSRKGKFISVPSKLHGGHKFVQVE